MTRFLITVILNGNALNHNIFNGCEVIPSTRFNFAEFDLFTCICGVSGCAGFQIPVVQTKTTETVKWVFPNDKSYAVKKLNYEFNRLQFEKEFEDLRSRMLELEKEKTHILACITDLGQYVGNKSEKDGRFEARCELADIFKWHEERYEALEKFNEMLSEKFPNLCTKKFYFKYEEKMEATDWSWCLSSLVSRALNKSPEKTGIKKYLKKAQEVAKTIEKAIVEKDYKDFIKVVHSSYEECCENPKDINEGFWYGFEFELCRLVKEEDFSVDKLSLVMAER